MDKYDVKRLVSLSGASVSAQQDKPKLVNRLIKFYMVNALRSEQVLPSNMSICPHM